MSRPLRAARATAVLVAIAVIAGRTHAQPAAAPASSSPSAAVQPRYQRDDRVRSVAQTLEALGALGPDAAALELELAAAARQRCGASGRPPALACLLPLAAAACERRPVAARAACAAAADAMLVNLRSANDWVDEPTRVRLVRGAADYHRALLGELARRYAALAAELVLEEPALARELGAQVAADAPASTWSLSPAVLDAFCARRDFRARPPRCSQPEPTCVPSLSWQRCVAALAWYVTQPALEPAPGPAAAPAPTAAGSSAATAAGSRPAPSATTVSPLAPAVAPARAASGGPR